MWHAHNRLSWEFHIFITSVVITTYSTAIVATPRNPFNPSPFTRDSASTTLPAQPTQPVAIYTLIIIVIILSIATPYIRNRLAYAALPILLLVYPPGSLLVFLKLFSDLSLLSSMSAVPNLLFLSN